MSFTEETFTKQDFLQSSYSRLQALTDINSSKWSLYFSGKRSPNLETLEVLAKKLSVSVGDIAEWMVIRRELHSQARRIKKGSKRNIS